MAKKKVTKITKKEVTPIKEDSIDLQEPVYGLIDSQDIMSDELYVKKIMNFLGYDLKRAAGYKYYTKSNRMIKPNFKEKEMLEVFKR